MLTWFVQITSLVSLFVGVRTNGDAPRVLCTTPNGDSAFCISLYSCPILLKALGSLQSASLDFVRQSQCGIRNDFQVCCGNSSFFATGQKLSTGSGDNEPPVQIWTETRGQNLSDFMKKRNILPDMQFCGFYNVTDGWPMPWLVLLKRQSSDQEEYIVCSGTLISRRYVLTVVECLFADITVLLGWYSLRRDTSLPGYHTGMMEVHVEEEYIHPKYDLALKVYNIALLRLSQDVTFSDYIKPICLPIDSHRFFTEGEEVLTSGRGTSVKEDPIKFNERIKHILVSNEHCQSAYEIDDYSAICIKEVTEDKEFCFGDIGSPIMHLYKNQWILEGVVSMTGSCTSDLPSVGIKISEFMEWILENMRE